MQLCKGKKANDIWVFVLNFSTIVPPDGRQTLHPYQLVLKSICLSYFFLQWIGIYNFGQILNEVNKLMELKKTFKHSCKLKRTAEFFYSNVDDAS